MNKKHRKSLLSQCLCVNLFALFPGQLIYAQIVDETPDSDQSAMADSAVISEIEGPSSVDSMLKQDMDVTRPALAPQWARDLTRTYFAFKQDLKNRYDLAIGGD